MTPTQVTIRRVLALAAPFFCAGVLAPSIAAAAEPVPFATATAPCAQGVAHLTFPVQQSSHPDVILRFRSIGSEGYIGDSQASFGPNDSGWTAFYPEVEAGIAPEENSYCSSGSVEASLADRPSTPATYSGVSTPLERWSSWLSFMAPGAGQYAISLVISQGAIHILGVSGILESSGEYSLGSLSAGDQELGVWAESGPTAIWSATVRELPVFINKLTFHQGCMAPGTGLPATFSVTGDTSITATVNNASGQVVRNLGTFSVKEGSASVPWDGRGSAGSNLPSGSYTLKLVSTDPQGDLTTAQATIYVATSGPTVSMTSPGTITPSQSVTFHVTDAGCGVGSARVEIDSETYGRTGEAFDEEGGVVEEVASAPSDRTLVFSPRTTWKLGAHHWKIEATDTAGNTRTTTGGFSVAKSLKKRPKPPWCGRILWRLRHRHFTRQHRLRLRRNYNRYCR